MTWTVPDAPDALTIALQDSWDGQPLRDSRLCGQAILSAQEQGLLVRGGLPDSEPGPPPAGPPGTRVPNLWQTDVVEVFWVGPSGRYVEIEVGAAGHYLVLSFDAPRRSSNTHENLQLETSHRQGGTGWETSIEIPWSLLPQPLERLNVFAIAKGEFVAAHAMPGETADFHQPDVFPRARLERLRES